MASLKTMENSAATMAKTMSAAAKMSGVPGAANHKSSSARIFTTAKLAIHGLRGPARSAIEPRKGDRIATQMPTRVTAPLHQAWPVAGSEASWETK